MKRGTRLLSVLLLTAAAAVLLDGCRRGEVEVIIRQLPPEERALYEQVKPFLKRIEENPQDVAAYTLAARKLRKAGHTQVARKVISEGLRNNPDNPELLLERADLFEALGRDKEAFSDYQKVLSRVPGAVEALRGAARTAFRLGDRKGAEQFLLRAKAAAPDDAGILLDEASFARLEGDFEKALDLCRTAQRLAPHLPEAFHNAAAALLALNRPEDALKEVEKALALAPEAVEALALKAEAAFALGKTDLARDTALKAVSLNPYFASPYRTLGRIAMAEGDIETAEKRFRQAVKADPSDVFSLYRLLAIASKKSDGELRLFALRRLSRRLPDDLGLREQLAQAAFEQKQFTEAAAEFRLLAEKDPSNPDYYRGLGKVYRHFEDWAGVVEAYSALERMKAAEPKERLLLARGCLESGLVERAEKIIRGLSSELPADDPELLFATGVLLEKQGRFKEALSYLSRAAENGDASAMWKAAISAAACGDMKTAGKFLEKLSAAAPERADVLRLLAEVKARLDQPDKAAELYGSLLLTHPDDLQALEFLAEYHLRRGDAEKALRFADEILMKDPGNGRGLMVKGIVLQQQGRFRAAYRMLSNAADKLGPLPELIQRLRDLEPKASASASVKDLWARYNATGDENLLWTIAEMETASPSPLRALRPLRMLADSPKTRRRALRKITDLYILTNREKAAVKTALRLASEYDDAPALFFAADTLAHFARYDKALSLLQEALRKQPDFAPALRLAAKIRLARNEPRLALNRYLALLDLDPASPDVLLAVARIYAFYLNDVQRTRVYYQRLLSRTDTSAPDIEEFLAKHTPKSLSAPPPLPESPPVPDAPARPAAPAAPPPEEEASPSRLGPDTVPSPQPPPPAAGTENAGQPLPPSR